MNIIVHILLSIVDIYILCLFVRLFARAHERYDTVLDMVFQLTEPLVAPVSTLMRPYMSTQAAPVPVIAVLLLCKGILIGSILVAVILFLDRVFQIGVLVIIILAAFQEAYVNPLIRFFRRLIAPLQTFVAPLSPQALTQHLLSVAVLVVLHALARLLVIGVLGGVVGSVQGALLHSVLQIVELGSFFTLVIFAYALMGWLNPDPWNPIVQLITMIATPILQPFRRFIPPLGGMLDISPVFAILALQVVQKLLYTVLEKLA